MILKTVLNYECFIGIMSKTDGGLYIPIQIKKIIYLHEIIMDDQSGFHKCNQWFSPLRINNRSSVNFRIKKCSETMFKTQSYSYLMTLARKTT